MTATEVLFGLLDARERMEAAEEAYQETPKGPFMGNSMSVQLQEAVLRDARQKLDKATDDFERLRATFNGLFSSPYAYGINPKIQGF